MTSKNRSGAVTTSPHLDRLRAASAAAVLVLLAGVAVFLSPGAAQAKAPEDLRVEVSDTALAPGGRTLVWLRSYADPAQRVQAQSASFKLSANLVAAGVTVNPGDEWNPNCTGDGSFINCSFEDTFFNFTPTGERSTYTVLTAGKSVPVGTEGTITATYYGYDQQQVTGTAKISVVEGVDLAAGPAPTPSAPPGGSFDLPLTLRNNGANVADGVGLSVDRPVVALQAATRFRNCRYDGVRLVSCSFDQQLQPGATYRATLPFKLRSDTLAPAKLAVALTWRTSTEHDAYLAEERALGKAAGTAGDGPLLELEAVTTAAAKRQADVDYRDNTSRVSVSVTGRNGFDLVALGAEVSGEAGAVVPMTVGLRNDGPAALAADQPAMTAKVLVTTPKGTEATAVPARCRQVVKGDPEWREPAEPDALQYLCRPGDRLEAGATESFRFGLRINTVIAGATGLVRVTAACGACELDKPDNEALIVANPTDGGGGDDGGGLPVTGTPVAAVVGAGLVLLVAGAGGVLVTRRRRTRFQV